MNVLPINNSNCANYTNFNGKVITKGKWPHILEKRFRLNTEVQKLAAGEYDIIGNLSHKISNGKDKKHYKGQNIYKVSIQALKENASILDRIKMFFGLAPKENLSKNYHSLDTSIDVIDTRVNSENLKEKLFG